MVHKDLDAVRAIIQFANNVEKRNCSNVVQNSSPTSAETYDVTIKFGIGGKPYFHYKQQEGRKQLTEQHLMAAVFFCPQLLTVEEQEELSESWRTRTDHPVDSEDHSQTDRKPSTA